MSAKRKVKIFKSVESELESMEADINTWLEETNSQLVSITGNIAPQTKVSDITGSFSASDILIVVVYEVANA